MATAQDTALNQSIRDYFRDALDWGQEFVDIFAPDAEVNVEGSIAYFETRLAMLRRLAVGTSLSRCRAKPMRLWGP